MGYDQHEKSSSSGAVVGILIAVLLIVVLGGLFLAGIGAFFFVASTRMETRQLVVAEQQASVQLEKFQAMTEMQQAEATAQGQHESGMAATLTLRLDYRVSMDRDGSMSVDGKPVGLDELKARLTRLKDETSNAFSVRFTVDSECPVKHLTPVLAVCDDIGDIDYQVTTPEKPEVTTGEAGEEDRCGLGACLEVE